MSTLSVQLNDLMKNIENGKMNEYVDPDTMVMRLDTKYSPNPSTLIFMIFLMLASSIGFMVTYLLPEDLDNNHIEHNRSLGYLISAGIYSFSIFYIIIHTIPKVIFHNKTSELSSGNGLGEFIYSIFYQIKRIFIHLFLNMFHFTTFLASLVIFIMIVLGNYEIMKIKMDNGSSIISNSMILFIVNLFIYVVLLAILVFFPIFERFGIVVNSQAYNGKMGSYPLQYTLLNLFLNLSSIMNAIFIVFIYIHCKYYVTDDLLNIIKYS